MAQGDGKHASLPPFPEAVSHRLEAPARVLGPLRFARSVRECGAGLEARADLDRSGALPCSPVTRGAVGSALRGRPAHVGPDLARVAVGHAPGGVAGVVARQRRVDGVGLPVVGVEQQPFAGVEIGAGVEDGLDAEIEPCPVLAVDLGQARVDPVALGQQSACRGERLLAGRREQRPAGGSVMDGLGVCRALHLDQRRQGGRGHHRGALGDEGQDIHIVGILPKTLGTLSKTPRVGLFG